MRHQLHIVPHEGEWAVRDTESAAIILTAPTQAEAISDAAEYAVEEEIDIVVHRRNGTFRNVISAETLQRRADQESAFCCGLSSKLFWSILAVGAVGGLAAYIMVNPPERLESVRRDLEDQLRSLKRRFS